MAKKLNGQLAIKGTIDLVTKINDDTIEVSRLENWQENGLDYWRSKGL